MKHSAVPDINAQIKTQNSPHQHLGGYWHKNLRMTAVLMAIWFVVTFGVSYFARELNFKVFGWPFSFWMAAQGAPVVYLIVVGLYAWRMDRLDQEHGVAEDD